MRHINLFVALITLLILPNNATAGKDPCASKAGNCRKACIKYYGGDMTVADFQSACSGAKATTVKTGKSKRSGRRNRNKGTKVKISNDQLIEIIETVRKLKKDADTPWVDKNFLLACIIGSNLLWFGLLGWIIRRVHLAQTQRQEFVALAELYNEQDERIRLLEQPTAAPPPNQGQNTPNP